MCAGREGQIAWRKVQRDPQSHVLGEHFVDFAKLFGQRSNASAYAFVWIESEKEQDAVLAIGADDGLVVWLNDKEVHRNLVSRGYTSKQDRVSVHLVKGRNKLLLKVTQGIGEWSFGGNLLGADGRLVEGIRYSLVPIKSPDSHAE